MIKVSAGLHLWPHHVLAVSHGHHSAGETSLTPNPLLPSAGLTVKEFLSLNFAGGWAGVLAWASIYPVDVVKSRLQTQSLETPQFKSFGHCASQLYRQEGAAIFVRGLAPTLLRAFPLNAVTFSFYELSMRVLEGRT